MTRKHSISRCSAIGVRTTPLLLVALLLASSTQAVANSEDSSMWHDARVGVDGGTLGAIVIPLEPLLAGDVPQPMPAIEFSMQPSDMYSVVEVYTATWCENCVITETALDEAIGDSDVVRIHYHRHWLESMDPFGNNATEDRWDSAYGGASTSIAGAPRLAPSIVFDGERMHIGKIPSSRSLSNDYATSLAAGQSSGLGGSVTHLSVMAYDPAERTILFSWDIGLHGSIGSCCLTLTPWLLFVEDNASFPEGTNGVGDYLHVLHDAVELEQLEGNASVHVPPAWDGDDMSAVLIIDWSIEQEESKCCSPLLPGPGVAAASLCFIVALLPSRRER